MATPHALHSLVTVLLYFRHFRLIRYIEKCQPKSQQEELTDALVTIPEVVYSHHMRPQFCCLFIFYQDEVDAFTDSTQLTYDEVRKSLVTNFSHVLDQAPTRGDWYAMKRNPSYHVMRQKK